MKYVAVGFRCDSSKSIFYVTAETLCEFVQKLERYMARHDPDFVSLRIVRDPDVKC